MTRPRETEVQPCCCGFIDQNLEASRACLIDLAFREERILNDRGHDGRSSEPSERRDHVIYRTMIPQVVRIARDLILHDCRT